MSAGRKFLFACGNVKSAGGNSLCQPMEVGTERQKENACYNLRIIDAFHDSLVTSKPTPLQIVSYGNANRISSISLLAQI
jgi:hypothetical protein